MILCWTVANIPQIQSALKDTLNLIFSFHSVKQNKFYFMFFHVANIHSVYIWNHGF